MSTQADGLRVLSARRDNGSIATEVRPHELAAVVAGGTIVIVKGAFDPAELRRVRSAILECKIPDHGEHQLQHAGSSRHRHEYRPESGIRHVFESYRLAVSDPGDRIGRAVREPFARLAEFWRSLTGCRHGFDRAADGLAVRPWAMHYPAGGGYFDWHEHPLLPQKIGLIAGMSEIGADFQSGATEFRTPFGIVNTMAHHDIGDVCLFRYDLAHRVTPIDPGRERLWDGAGRWTLVMPLQ